MKTNIVSCVVKVFTSSLPTKIVIKVPASQDVKLEAFFRQVEEVLQNQGE